MSPSETYSADELREMLVEIRKDQTAFRVARSRILRRYHEVEQRMEDGEIHTPMTEFAGTKAVLGALEISITHMEYMEQAVQAQVDDAEHECQLTVVDFGKGSDDER